MKVRKVTEVSCYMDNQPGVLGNVASALAKENINIIGVHSYEGHLQSMTRFVVADENTLKTEMILRGLGIEVVTQSEVIEVSFRSKIGFMATLCSRLGKEGINIQMIYFTESLEGETLSYISVDRTDDTIAVLEAAAKTDEFSQY